MPKVVWTSENDRKLLIRLIERSAKSYDTVELCKIFPGATPKAIEERIAKLKREAKAMDHPKPRNHPKGKSGPKKRVATDASLAAGAETKKIKVMSDSTTAPTTDAVENSVTDLITQPPSISDSPDIADVSCPAKIEDEEIPSPAKREDEETFAPEVLNVKCEINPQGDSEIESERGPEVEPGIEPELQLESDTELDSGVGSDNIEPSAEPEANSELKLELEPKFKQELVQQEERQEERPEEREGEEGEEEKQKEHHEFKFEEEEIEDQKPCLIKPEPESQRSLNIFDSSRMISRGITRHYQS